ncbi:helix-turn-helix domain-containing protein [Paenibacillus cymbidii]|uniref:helix-turn-helix domain-containing protein n=1 Tax=Paenibacillus cymbidii TaxID=1639034 RepID=UPI0010819EAA|nr:AraC family transcriptional regulator [Paenibacillus cymbidii]
MDLLTYHILHRPISPFIRNADYAFRNPHTIPERRLYDYLIQYVQEGYCIVCDDREEHLIQAGELCLIQPDTPHTMKTPKQSSIYYVHMDIFYNPERDKCYPVGRDISAQSHLIQPRLNDFEGIDIPLRIKPEDPHYIRRTMHKLIETWQNHDIVHQLQAQQIATELVLYVLQEYSAFQLPKIQDSLAMNSVLFFLSKHYGRQISVHDMSSYVNLSPSRFSALFRAQFNISPHQYLLQLRCKQAIKLLETTDYPQEAIAEQCGFADVHHFSKSFKKMTGNPPGFYRRSSMD